MAMQRCDPAAFAEQIARGREWVVGMQSGNGGWGAFDAENRHAYMNDIPFADHGAMLDQPTADVTARCLSMLAQLGESESETVRRAYRFLLKEKEKDGSWFGRWGVNYIFGTWGVLSALNAVGLAHGDARIQRAVKWLLSIQNGDGGWGEDPSSYRLDYTSWEPAPSTASQTAWALLGLMAAGEVRHAGVVKGVAYLQRTQEDHGLWEEEHYTGTGFPRVMYSLYHGYSKYFPLMALARYRNLMGDNSVTVPFGM
ncbi:probable squalene--hopene cyclase [Bemisia tabaci]|uniref:probable squalene--hopene cyclase n=1 Tax=Bemisia tabaci TaxID=7038 RepID=UPI003B28B74D